MPFDSLPNNQAPVAGMDTGVFFFQIFCEVNATVFYWYANANVHNDYARVRQSGPVFQ